MGWRYARLWRLHPSPAARHFHPGPADGVPLVACLRRRRLIVRRARLAAIMTLAVKAANRASRTPTIGMTMAHRPRQQLCQSCAGEISLPSQIVAVTHLQRLRVVVKMPTVGHDSARSRVAGDPNRQAPAADRGATVVRQAERRLPGRSTWPATAPPPPRCAAAPRQPRPTGRIQKTISGHAVEPLCGTRETIQRQSSKR